MECAVALIDKSKRLDTDDFIEKLDSHDLTEEERSKRINEHWQEKLAFEPQLWPQNVESFECFQNAMTQWQVDGFTGQRVLRKEGVAADLIWSGYSPGTPEGKRIWDDIRIMEVACLNHWNKEKTRGNKR